MEKIDRKLPNGLKELIPKAGFIFSEKSFYNEILCKPKLLPLKSFTLIRLEQMEKDMLDLAKKEMQQQDSEIFNRANSNN